MKMTLNTPLVGWFCSTLLLMASTASYATPEYRIGLATWTGYPENIQGFKDGLVDKGMELDKVAFIQGARSSDQAVQEQSAQQMLAKNVDLVYSLTTPGTLIIKKYFPEHTPIVFSIVTYPADSGLIESFEYSGNNLVGTSNYISLQHYIQLIDTMMPNATNVAIFHRKGEPNSKIQASNLIRLLKRRKITVNDIEANNLSDLQHKASSIANQVDLFITTTDTLLQNGGEEVLIDVASKTGIPILSSNKKGIEKGATFGPVADFYSLGRQSGHLAAEILMNGTEPRHLQSSLQKNPVFLINRTSIEQLNINTEKLSLFNHQWH